MKEALIGYVLGTALVLCVWLFIIVWKEHQRTKRIKRLAEIVKWDVEKKRN